VSQGIIGFSLGRRIQHRSETVAGGLGHADPARWWRAAADPATSRLRVALSAQKDERTAVDHPKQSGRWIAHGVLRSADRRLL
jgi:hypothetical protein